jgi:transcriptional regulator with XRE-family HTH domain
MDKLTDFNSIADLVKKTRYEKNYSQDHIAKKLGITQKAYSKIENNETKLNVDTLTRIAEILEVDVASFFSSNEKPVLNDFSTRTGGDNVIYKNNSIEKIEELYKEIIKAKDSEIETLKVLLKNTK